VSAATVKHLDPTQVELEISISREELDAANERAFRQLARTAKIPGFRPGKAPRKVFEAQYGSEIINERAMDALVPDVYLRAIRDNDLEPVDQPQMELLPLEEGQPLRLRATVNVRPEIALHDYKGMELAGLPTAVADAEVDKALESLQREAATLVPVDRAVAAGDVATLDYEGRIDGVPFEGGKAENQPTEIATGRFVPGFIEGIIGMQAGQSKDISVTFPAEYPKPELAGKEALFTILVREVKVAEYPPLDDEFAKRFNPETDLNGLRAEIRARLEQTANTRARRALGTVLVDRLLAKHDFPLPAVMVEREAESIFQGAKEYVARAGLNWDDYLKQQDRSDEVVRAEYRAEAEKRVKTTLLLEAIAKTEKIEATEKDLETEIGSLARQYGQPRQAIIEMLRPNLPSLVDGIVRSKTLDFLLDQAKIGEAPADPEATKTAPAESC